MRGRKIVRSWASKTSLEVHPTLALKHRKGTKLFQYQSTLLPGKTRTVNEESWLAIVQVRQSLRHLAAPPLSEVKWYVPVRRHVVLEGPSWEVLHH